MGKLQVPPASVETAQSDTYRPALDAHARQLIARIQRDPSDTAAVLALKTHYEAHGDQPSLVNLMQGWAETLREPEAAADAYVAAADAAPFYARSLSRPMALRARSEALARTSAGSQAARSAGQGRALHPAAAASPRIGRRERLERRAAHLRDPKDRRRRGVARRRGREAARRSRNLAHKQVR